MKKYFRGISFYILIILVAISTLTVFSNKLDKGSMIYSEFKIQLEEKNVKSIVYYTETQSIDVVLYNNLGNAVLEQPEPVVSNLLSQSSETVYEVTIPDTISFNELISSRPSGEFSYEIIVPTVLPEWISFIPTAIVLVLFIVIWVAFFQQMQGGGSGGGKVMSFGKSRAKVEIDEKKKVTFDDVAGVDEEKEELREIVEFLKQPKKFTDIGARIPKGVLLVGPPGTGKTLLARAVAGEAGVPFFSISGSDFVEMFVGVGASRVRDLFDQAKKNSPCIVFIDEIDAVGRHRGAGLGGGHDEREQTLNQLLVEMDGFGQNEGVIILAATNRPDILDPALLRPGRFDRQVMVGAPDVKGREAILRVHSKSKPLSDNIDLAVLAKNTAGFTGADLENMLNEGALLAARKNKKVIEMEDLEEAMVKVMMGPEKKSKVMSEKEKKLVAYHEAGHAVVSKFLPSQDQVHQVSIIPRGMAGGYTMYMPSEDKNFISKTEMEETIVSMLGGRVAEKLIIGDISTGAQNDIERATGIATDMVTKYGMSDTIGTISYKTNHEVFLGKDYGQTKSYSEETAGKIDEEVKRIMDNSFKRAEDILTTNIDKLHAVANVLIEKEKIEGEEFDRIFENA